MLAFVNGIRFHVGRRKAQRYVRPRVIACIESVDRSATGVRGRLDGKKTEDTTSTTPFLPVTGARLVWEEVDEHSCYVVRPPESVAPRWVAHFVGGFLVGAAPRLAYQNLIEMLAESGVIVIVTPYSIRMDYLEVVAETLERFEKGFNHVLNDEIARLPIVGIGHSLGALLHVILASLFPEGTRAANVLISFNNRSARDVIPSLDQIVSGLGSLGPFILPNEAQKELINRATVEAVHFAHKAPLIGSDLSHTLYESIGLIAQLEPLLEELAGGQDEFCPPPEDVRVAAQRGYDVLRTLVVQFNVDSIDQSDLAVEYLSGRTDLQSILLDGTHVTPLQPDPLNVVIVPPVEEILAPVRDPILASVRQLHASIHEFLGLS